MMRRHQPRSTLFPYTTLFRSQGVGQRWGGEPQRPGAGTQLAEQALGVGQEHALEREDADRGVQRGRSEEHTSELQSLRHIVCRLVLEKKNTNEISCVSRRLTA